MTDILNEMGTGKKPATGTMHQNLKFKAIKLCDFKMDLIKWQLNFVSGNLGCDFKSNSRSFDFEITRTTSNLIIYKQQFL